VSFDLYCLLLGIVCIGVRHLALHLPIPPELVQRYREHEAARTQLSVTDPPDVDDETDDEAWFCRRDRDDTDDDYWTEFSVNIDGTPMLGDTDIHGNAFGVTGSTFDEW